MDDEIADQEALRREIRGKYRVVAVDPDRSSGFCTGRPLAQRFGYPASIGHSGQASPVADRCRFLCGECQTVAWSDQPTAEAFFERHASIGATSRRLAGLEGEQARAKFFVRVRARLARLAPEDFRDTSEVLAAVAQAPENA